MIVRLALSAGVRSVGPTFTQRSSSLKSRKIDARLLSTRATAAAGRNLVSFTEPRGLLKLRPHQMQVRADASQTILERNPVDLTDQLVLSA